MRLHHPIGLLLLFVALAPGRGPALAGDSAAEAGLKTKGLTKSGRVFVVEDEKAALAKMKEGRSSFNAYATSAGKQAAFERYQAESGQLEEHRAELKTSLDDLNQRIIEQAASQGGTGSPRPGPGGGTPWGSGSPLITQRNQVKASLDEVTQGQKTLKAEAPVVKDKAALDDEVKKRAETFKTDLAALRATFDQVTKKYTDLAADASVKQWLGDLNKAGQKVKLGPSDAFTAAAKELDQAERRFLGKQAATPAKKKTKSRR